MPEEYEFIGEKEARGGITTRQKEGDLRYFSLPDLGSAKTAIADEKKNQRAAYVKTNTPVGEELSEEQYAALEEAYNNSDEAKSLDKRAREIEDEEELRTKTLEATKEAASKSGISFTGNSVYNSARYADAIDVLDESIDNIKELETKKAESEKELKAAKEKNDTDAITKAEESLAKIEIDIKSEEANKEDSEERIAAQRSIIDKHNAVINSLPMAEVSEDERVTESVKGYNTALNDAKGGTVFDGDARQCQTIALGSISTDEDILNAIRDAAIKGLYRMTFEASLWTWNARTLRDLNERGFLLDLKPSTDAYDKEGNKIGRQSTQQGILNVPFKNTDLIVIWEIDQYEESPSFDGEKSAILEP